MLVEYEDLMMIDSRLYEEDKKKYTKSYEDLVEFLYRRRQDEDFDKNDMAKIPLYWSEAVLAGVRAMVVFYPAIKFLFIRSMSYGVKIHHTTTTHTINQLNNVKLKIAKTVDDEICNRIEEFYKRENTPTGE
jgi:hypothetical protein